MTKTRTDIHRPSAIVPLDYDYLGVFYQGGSEDMEFAYRGDHQELDQILGDNWWELIGVPDGNYKTKNTCDHCGANFAHGVIYRHRPTSELLVVGHICGHDTLLPATDRAGQRKKLNERNAARHASLRRNREYREAHPELIAAFALAHEERFEGCYAAQWHVSTLLDIERRFTSSSPELSDRQADFVLKLAEELPGKLEDQARRDAEKAAAEDVPEDGRQTVTGVVLKAEWRENEFGGSLKITVKDDRGFVVWGTAAAAIADVEKGQRVTFKARLSKSDNDPKFGFFSRPTAARSWAL